MAKEDAAEKKIQNLPERHNEDVGTTSERDNETVSFLGKQYCQSEYREICRNLAEFFAILRSWREKDRGQ